MPTLRRSTDVEIAAFTAAQADAAYSYTEVGATRAELPDGYRIDRAAYRLGHGEPAFERAVAAMRSWRQYDDPAGRIRICEPRPPLRTGADVLLLVRHLGLWTLSACRVVYVFDEPRSFGFAYGTCSDGVSVAFGATSLCCVVSLLTTTFAPRVNAPVFEARTLHKDRAVLPWGEGSKQERVHVQTTRIRRRRVSRAHHCCFCPRG